MMVSAVAQTLMGVERREGQERAADANERFQLEMQKLKEDHHDINSNSSFHVFTFIYKIYFKKSN